VARARAPRRYQIPRKMRYQNSVTPYSPNSLTAQDS
jgi:hypothetical protein